MAGAMASGILLDFEFGDTAITTLSFIRDVVVDAKHYGDQVPAVRARLSYDIARINSFVEFLRRRAPDGEPQLGKLQDASQNAVIGLIQELEFTLAGFTAYVNKHDIVDLRRGYVKSTRGVLEGDALASRVAEAEGILSTADVKQKLRWGIFEKSRIMTILRDLEDWGDRAMNLLLCVVSFHSGVEGKNAATLTDSKFVSAGLDFKALMDNEVPSADDFLQHLVNPTRIPQLEGPEARTALLHISGPASLPKRVWMEFKPFELRRKSTEPTEAVKQAAQRLARLLGHPKAQEAGFRTLRCISLLQLLKPNPAFALVFELPEDRFPAHRNPTTLLKSIESKTIDRPTLDQRFAMARCLVKTLFHLHSVDWLHKSIRSNNILFGYDPSSATRPDYSHPYLVGFEFSRDERDRSTTDQDDQLDRNIYRHPDRQGPPEKRFSAMHDHYALGVVLLEIGLWRPVLGFEEDYDEMSPDEIMLSLQEHAKDRLPHYMGLDYTEAVLACLNGSLQTRVTVGQTGMSDSQRLGLNLALLEKVLNKIKLRGGDPSISQS